MDELTRLALAAAEGDRFALGAWVRRSQAEVWRLCAGLVDRQVADDLTQETYLRAIPALGGFRADSSARTWLLSIARRVCADEIRRRTRRRALVDRLAGRRTSDVTAARTGEVELELLLADIDADQREAFVLTQLLGLEYAEAAAVVGCPIGTIRSRVARARGRLADLVDGDRALGS